MRRGFWGVAALLAAMASSTAEAALTAWLDSNDVAPGDTVQLTLQHDGRTNDQPDLGPLQQDFEVLGSSRNSSVQIINGNVSANTQVQLTLSPKHSGRLSVPAITWDGDRSATLALNVTGSGTGTGVAGSGQPAKSSQVFMETDVDHKSPLVQAAVNVTVRLYSAEPLYHADLNLPVSGDALVQQIGADKTRDVERTGRHYQVTERHYLVFPQHSGQLSLPGAVLDAEVAARGGNSRDPFDSAPFADFFGQKQLAAMLTATRPLRLHGDPIVLQVRPRPADAAGAYWLPARQVVLKGQWNPDALRVRAGDPLTLNLKLQAEGLTAAQLPDLAPLLALPDGVKAYPDEAKLNNAIQGDTVVGSREQNIALIADLPGRFALPALHIHWWDTQADVAREAVLPAQTLVILPAAGGAANPAAQISTAKADFPTALPARPAHPSPPLDVGNKFPWMWISLGVSLIWLATVAAWFGSHELKSPRRSSAAATPKHEENPSSLRSAFLRACRDNDAAAARRSLLLWARSVWPDAPPAGLDALAKRLGSPGPGPLLRDLDRACYAGGQWHGDALASVLPELSGSRRQDHDCKTELAPLYP